MAKRRTNGLLSFLTKKRTTYHGRVVRSGSQKPRRMARFKGVQVWKMPDGSYTTAIDKDSRHDTLGDAHRFITSWKKNPAKFDRCVSKVQKSLKKRGASGNAYAICTASGARNKGKKTRKNILPLSAFDVISAPAVVQGYSQAKKYIRRKLTGRKRKRKNPVEAAAQAYEGFHGRPSEKLTKIKRTVHVHSVLAGIGKLEALVIRPIHGRSRDITLSKFGAAQLAMNEKRTQLFIEGGDQSVNLAEFGIDKPYHESEVLGECVRVDYFTTKDHLRPEDGGTAVYRHTFGRKKPLVVYDTVNKQLSFAGGGYTLPDEGIDN